jgi:hypothetical protein
VNSTPFISLSKIKEGKTSPEKLPFKVEQSFSVNDL